MSRPSVREDLNTARCVQEFSIVVHGAIAPDGAAAVILGLLPHDEKGWTFPMSVSEARVVAARLIEVADAKEFGVPS